MSDGRSGEQLQALVRRALAEDVGSGDVTTSATVEEYARARALITQKAPGVIYGLAVTERVFAELDDGAVARRRVQEGVWREEGGRCSRCRARRARC